MDKKSAKFAPQKNLHILEQLQKQSLPLKQIAHSWAAAEAKIAPRTTCTFLSSCRSMYFLCMTASCSCRSLLLVQVSSWAPKWQVTCKTVQSLDTNTVKIPLPPVGSSLAAGQSTPENKPKYYTFFNRKSREFVEYSKTLVVGATGNLGGRQILNELISYNRLTNRSKMGAIMQFPASISAVQTRPNKEI